VSICRGSARVFKLRDAARQLGVICQIATCYISGTSKVRLWGWFVRLGGWVVCLEEGLWVVGEDFWVCQ
jgi:hypothetical protein